MSIFQMGDGAIMNRLRALLLILCTALTCFIVVQVSPLHSFIDTHDGTNHLARFANYRIALREGQLPPRWGPNLLNNYGYPVFVLNYPLLNILSLPFTIGGLSYETTFNLLSSLLLVVGILGVHFWLRQLYPTKSKSASILAILAYVSAPYVWNLLFVRGSIGELAAYAVFPWVLFSFERLRLRKATWLHVMTAGVIYAVFLLSHNISAMIGSIILAIWLLTAFSFSWHTFKLWIISGLIGIGLASWFWIPALVEASETVVFQAGNNKLAGQHLSTLSQAIYSPLQFGYSMVGAPDSFSVMVGPFFVIMATVCAVYLLHLRLVRSKTTTDSTRPVFVALLLFLLLSVLQLNAAQTVWDVISALSIVQFPWRFSLFGSIFATVVVYWLWSKSSVVLQCIWLLLLLSLLLIEVTAIPSRGITRVNEYYEQFAETTSTQHENMPRSFLYQDIWDWKPEPTVLSGEASIAVSSWSGTNRSYTVLVETPTIIVEPTAHFLGWSTQVNNTDTLATARAAYIDSEIIRGRIAYELSPGSYEVTTAFSEQVVDRQVGNGISLLTVAAVTVVAVSMYRKKRK